MTGLLPLHGGRGMHGWAEGSLAALPFLGAFLLLLALGALAAFYLLRQGRLQFGGRSPEDDARRILAERFARGDISSDEFLERASTLNWTPGSDTLPPRPGQRKG